MLINHLQSKKNWGILLPISLAMLISLAIVTTATLFFKDFFFIDDAQNAFLPFCKEIGRIILSGHLPVLTTNIFLGGNILLDMVHSPFSPQTILTGLLVNQVDSFQVAANFLAWFNITLVISGSYWLGRILTIRHSYALLLGFIVATNPIFLYVYAASWWNFASAFAWFTVSFSALLQFRQNQTSLNFLFAVIFLCLLFASAGTHMHFVYLASFCVIFTIDGYQNRSFNRLLNLVLIILCASFIAAIPLMSEFILNSNLITRGSAFTNSDNFLVPSWGSVINAFNPFYATYIHWFGGYRHIPLSLGYIGIISILLFFTEKKKPETTLNHKIVFSIVLLLIVLVFSSTQFGPLRWPFRYLPVWSMMVSALVIFYIDKSTFHFSRKKKYQLSGLIIIAALIQLFSSDTFVFKVKNIIFAILFILLSAYLVICFFKFKDNQKKRTQLLWTITILAWVGMLAQSPTLAKKGYIPYNPNITAQALNIPATPPPYYVLGLTPNMQGNKLDITDIGSAQLLLFGKNTLKSINGYTPVGHNGMRELLPYPSVHGLYKPYESLKNISQPSSVDPVIFDYQLMNIGYISAWKVDITPEISQLLSQAGLQIEPYGLEDRVLIKPKKLRRIQSSLTYQSIEGLVTFNHKDGMMHEWFDIEKTTAERILIFSRVYWHGYHAIIDGKEYPVTSYKNALVKVVVPSNVSGQMHLYYEPVSWRFTKWFIIIGILLTIYFASSRMRNL